MNMSKKMRAMAAGTFAVVAQVVLPGAPVLAASGTATITRLVPASGPAGTAITVNGAGCVTNGVANISAEVLLRGPGASTTIVFRRGAFVNDQRTASSFALGTFLGQAVVPENAVTGSTYTVSAQCTEQGQPPGPESAGVVFTVTAPGTGATVGGTDAPADTGGTTRVATTTGAAITGAATTGAAITGAATTTGRATPIPSQPRFTG